MPQSEMMIKTLKCWAVSLALRTSKRKYIQDVELFLLDLFFPKEISGEVWRGHRVLLKYKHSFLFSLVCYFKAGHFGQNIKFSSKFMIFKSIRQWIGAVNICTCLQYLLPSRGWKRKHLKTVTRNGIGNFTVFNVSPGAYAERKRQNALSKKTKTPSVWSGDQPSCWLVSATKITTSPFRCTINLKYYI